MKTIYELQQIANRLRQVTEVNSISPEDTFGLQSDILEYMADMEQNAEGLGIHKVYASYAAMVADASAPVGSNGKALRFGQLVVICNPSNTIQEENGNIYAWQKGNAGDAAWLLIGNLGSVLGNPQNGYYVCDTAAATAEKEISATGYVLSVGGSMKVKMANANTADNATLNINSTGVKALYYAGERASANNSWEAGETVEVYYDGTSYYANSVAGGSGSGDGAFDVSAKYPTSGVDGGNTYTLDGALAVLNANLSASKKKGGMSIKFIQSSDNKYVQARCMAQNFTTDVTQWQCVTNEIKAGSKDLVESGAVYVPLHNLDQQINGGSDTYEADIETTSATYVRPTIHYAEVDIPQGTYNLSANLNGTFAKVVVYFYDEDNAQITGIKDKDSRDYDNVATGNFIYNPFTFPKDIKKIGLYQDNKITDGTIEIMLSSVAATGIVGDISEIKEDIQSLETNKASKAEVAKDVERVEGKIESVSESLNDLKTEVGGEDKSKSISINFIANVPINSAGSQYPTEFSLKAGTYNLICSGKPAGLSLLNIYFYDDENNAIVVTDKIGETYNSMGLPPYDSRQPFTFPTDVASIKFYGGTPSENFTLVFNAQDTNKDPSLRELLEDIDVTPDVVLPKKLYLLSSSVDTIENSIYHKHYMSFQNPRFGIDIRRGFGWRISPRFLRIKANGTSIQSPTIYLYDVPNRKILKTITPNVITGLKETNNGAKVINCIGDSFTYNGVWFNHINELCSNLTFVGMRHSYNAGETLRAEGRGGWRLSDYFQPHSDVTPAHMQPFSPFMHVSGYTYYGVIDFWKAIVNDNSQYTYGTDGFDDYKSWFDTSGYKINPPTNALMYDGVNDKYVYYNGSSWADFNGTPTFVFDYAKYISTWNITSPDFVMIMLGTNDFGGNNAVSDADWVIWKNRMDEVISSIRTYAASVSKSIVIGLCTPTVRYGAENSSYGVNQDIYSYGTFDGRKRIINTFETTSYEAIGVYVVDTGIAVDTEYGFEEWNTEVNELPFSYYTGSFREIYGYNDPHPSAGGYKQIGVVGAAFIQAKR